MSDFPRYKGYVPLESLQGGILPYNSAIAPGYAPPPSNSECMPGSFAVAGQCVPCPQAGASLPLKCTGGVVNADSCGFQTCSCPSGQHSVNDQCVSASTPVVASAPLTFCEKYPCNPARWNIWGWLVFGSAAAVITTGVWAVTRKHATPNASDLPYWKRSNSESCGLNLVYKPLVSGNLDEARRLMTQVQKRIKRAKERGVDTKALEQDAEFINDTLNIAFRVRAQIY